MLCVVLAGGLVAAAPAEVTPEQAIAAAVERVLGSRAVVSVAGLDTAVAAEAGLTAEVEPGARLGRLSRFTLLARGARRGLARATVQARGPQLRASRAIARDEIIGSDAVELSEDELPGLPIRPLLRETDVVGRGARRTIAAGEVLTLTAVRLPPVVRSGEEVTVTVRIGAVRVTGVGRASGSGQVGDTVRVMTPNNLRQLWPARVTGPGAVEILE
jgi:flagella basal body P-ring formation protein FlgA